MIRIHVQTGELGGFPVETAIHYAPARGMGRVAARSAGHPVLSWCAAREVGP